MVIPPVYVEFPQSGKPKELISKERKIPIDDVELENVLMTSYRIS